jgi:histidinol-phosphate aminotransferase
MSYEYERPSAPRTGLRLHLNENTAGCSPRVLEALRRVTREEVAFYPDYDEVTAATARFFDVAAERVVLTNGLDEGILAVALAALRLSAPGAGDAVVVVPAFDMYAACVDAAGGRVVEVPMGADFEFPLQRVMDAVTTQTRVVFLTNPNNPTGGLIPRVALRTIAEHAPHALVFVDEAYADFSGATVLGDPVFAALENVVVGRTFAKAYGLAGVRAGALVAHPATMERIRKVLPPYSLNAYAVAAVRAAIEDSAYVDWYRRQVEQSKALMYQAFDRLGVRHWKSAGNFVLINLGPDAPAIVAALARLGVIVRDRSSDPACAGCARVAAGGVEHTKAFVAALEEVLCGAQ